MKGLVFFLYCKDVNFFYKMGGDEFFLSYYKEYVKYGIYD